MYELKKKIEKIFTSKSVGTGPSSYEKRIYPATVSQKLTNTCLKGLSSIESFILSTAASGQEPEIILYFPDVVYHIPVYVFDSRVTLAVITSLSPRRTGFIPRPFSVGFVLQEVTLGLNIWECLGFSI